MKEQAEQEERKEPRRDILLILLIIPLGICCMFVAGQAAIKFAPTWKIAADMGSNLDPNIDFSADTIPELIEPVSSNILTQPVWGGSLSYSRRCHSNSYHPDENPHSAAATNNPTDCSHPNGYSDFCPDPDQCNLASTPPATSSNATPPASNSHFSTSSPECQPGHYEGC